MARRAWSERQIGDLAGRRIVVTGANSGIGLAASRLFAAAGAEVVLAVRSLERGRHAADAITGDVPGAHLEVALVDLASLASVRAFADTELGRPGGIDVLVNNAGTSTWPEHAATDGWERQMETNLLGHFALTGLLLPRIRPGGRVVMVSSMMARRGSLSASTTLDDFRPREPYHGGQRYADSKQADLLFAVELDRRLRAAGLDVRSLACHPGGAATGLWTQRARARGLPERLSPSAAVVRPFLQSSRAGSWPTVYAATAPGLRGGELVAPRVFGVWGRPVVVPVFATGRDPAAGARLWQLAVEATGVDFGGL